MIEFNHQKALRIVLLVRHEKTFLPLFKRRLSETYGAEYESRRGRIRPGTNRRVVLPFNVSTYRLIWDIYGSFPTLLFRFELSQLTSAPIPNGVHEIYRLFNRYVACDPGMDWRNSSEWIGAQRRDSVLSDTRLAMSPYASTSAFADAAVALFQKFQEEELPKMEAEKQAIINKRLSEDQINFEALELLRDVLSRANLSPSEETPDRILRDSSGLYFFDKEGKRHSTVTKIILAHLEFEIAIIPSTIRLAPTEDDDDDETKTEP